MTDTSTPEWRHFFAKEEQAFEEGLISEQHRCLLRYASTPERATNLLTECKREYGEYRLLRDMWKAERDARNRWWITIAIAAASVLVVLAALYYSRKPCDIARSNPCSAYSSLALRAPVKQLIKPKPTVFAAVGSARTGTSASPCPCWTCCLPPASPPIAPATPTC